VHILCQSEAICVKSKCTWTLDILLSRFIGLLEVNFCELNVDGEVMLLLNISLIVTSTSSKSSLDGRN